jgi:hypothetical protein
MFHGSAQAIAKALLLLFARRRFTQPSVIASVSGPLVSDLQSRQDLSDLYFPGKSFDQQIMTHDSYGMIVLPQPGGDMA